ncbi:hypothetical protein PCANC_16298 [Puccinia coronata f. sp. avenae]|uniref:Uncharacterized protein n=1 Tax=Puccinia coronata f. sp. avenae TaxID=200324 RepID=A0A2N5UH14_9BASI|nr:hypothetical protein PCANC_16298 [Puccinia coronata f. sp. avenae]
MMTSSTFNSLNLKNKNQLGRYLNNLESTDKENQRAPSSWWGEEIAELAIKDLKRTGQLVRGDGYLAKFSTKYLVLDKIESLANMSQIQALIPQAEAILPQTEAILPQAEAMLPPIEAVAHHLPTLRSVRAASS